MEFDDLEFGNVELDDCDVVSDNDANDDSYFQATKSPVSGKKTNYVDMVFCVCITSNMKNYLPFIKTVINHFYDYICCKYNYGYSGFPDQLRIKIIGFGSTENSRCNSLVESEFFLIPQQRDVLSQYLDTLEVTDAYGLKNNALYAIAKAMNSDWHRIKDLETEKNRQIVVMMSDSASLSFEELNDTGWDFDIDHNKSPQNYNDFYYAWQPTGYPLDGSYTNRCSIDKRAGRIVLIVPENEYPWEDMSEEFDYTIVVPFSGEILSDKNCIGEVLAKAFIGHML